MTLASRLQDHKELEDIGGVSYLSKLAHSVPTTANIESYVASVHNKFMTREFIRSSMAGIQAAMAGEDIQRLVTSAQQVATTLADQAAPKQDFKRISNVLVDVIESTENKAEVYKTGKVTGIETGYTDLDAILAACRTAI